MKKLATTFGLLALMLVVTSFTSPNDIGGGGNQSAPRGRGLGIYSIGGGGNQSAPRGRDLGIYSIGGGGNQSAPRGRGLGIN
jgi:hypothetical protein